MSASPAIQDLLDRIRLSALDVSEARTMPAGAYTSPEFFAFEKEKVFYREWLCLGHQNQLAGPGSAFTISVVDEPLIVLRDRENAIHVFSAICPHRGFPVVRGNIHESCTHDRLVCPYHRWTFDLGGRLLGAPHMTRTIDDEALRAETTLREFRMEIVQGFIFVNFDDDAAPLRPTLSKFEDECTNYGIPDMVPMPSLVRTDLRFNWKIMHENALEPYHTMFVHDGYHDLAPARLAAFMPFEDNDGQIMHPTGFLKGVDGMNPFGRAPFPVIPTLTDTQRGHIMYGSLPPTMFFGLKPDQVFVFLILPQGPDTITLVTMFLVPRSTLHMKHFDWAYQSQLSASAVFGQQDVEANLVMQEGFKSRFVRPGRYSHLEETLPQFNRWLLRRYLRGDPEPANDGRS